MHPNGMLSCYLKLDPVNSLCESQLIKCFYYKCIVQVSTNMTTSDLMITYGEVIESNFLLVPLNNLAFYGKGNKINFNFHKQGALLRSDAKNVRPSRPKFIHFQGCFHKNWPKG